jgi:hypothetical protein
LEWRTFAAEVAEYGYLNAAHVLVEIGDDL